MSPSIDDHLLLFASQNLLILLLPASWSWNGSHPSGEVAEKKAEGEVSIQSKRGNTIKKSAQPDDPAIHLSRPGNDVVKNASELHVDEKKSSDAAADGAADDAATEEEPEKEEEPAEKQKPAQKEKTNGTTPAKKGGVKRKANDEGEGNGEKKVRGRPKGMAKKESTGESNGEKKTRGRPKKEGGAIKEKKPKTEKPMKPKAPPSGVGKRTRSQA